MYINLEWILKGIFTKLLVVFYILIFAGCGVSYTIGDGRTNFSDEELESVVASGNLIISAINRYKDNTSDLPDDLQELVSAGYLQLVPKFRTNQEYFYSPTLPLDDKDFLVSAFLSGGKIGSVNRLELIYRSNGDYEIDSRVEIIRSVGQWVYEVVHFGP